MPTMDELEGLYNKGAGSRNMTPLLKPSGWYIWAGKTRTRSPSYAWFLNFISGQRSWRYHEMSSFNWAFAVRFRR